MDQIEIPEELKKMVECVGCSEQFDENENFERSEFATDSYCKFCSYNAHEQALAENGLESKEIEKEMSEWKLGSG